MMYVVACLHCLMRNTANCSHPNCGAGQGVHHCGTEHLYLLGALVLRNFQACLHGVQSHLVAGNYRKQAVNSASAFVACIGNRCHICIQPIGKLCVCVGGGCMCVHTHTQSFVYSLSAACLYSKMLTGR